MTPEIEKAIKEWAYWYHKNQLLVDRGDKPSDSEIDFEVEAWNRLVKLIPSPLVL